MATYKLPNGGVITFTPTAEATISSYASGARGASEGGGVLLGRMLLGSNDIMVDGVTEPGPKDIRRPYSFKRNKAYHQRLVDEAWAASGGTMVFLGGWHTHPEPVPTPSGVDIKDWVNETKKATYEQDHLVFAIAGTERTRLWLMSRRSKQPVEVELVP